MALPLTNNEPTAFEQAMLEYINHSRMDPGGEYARLVDDGTGAQDNIARAVEFFGVDTAAFRAQMAEFESVAPLAWNGALSQAATDHSQLMIDNDSQSHREPGEKSLGDRARDAGYDYRVVAENVYSYTDDPLHGHAGFMIDWGFDAEDFSAAGQRLPDWQTLGDGIQDPAGHRNSIMSDRFVDIGIGALAENDPDTEVGPYVVTQNFGAPGGDDPAQLLGVVLNDTDSDDFYDIGEGLAGVTVTATGDAGTFTTTTWGSGGYQMELPQGTYSVSFAGGDLQGPTTLSVVMLDKNKKLDVFDGQTGSDTPEAPDTSRDQIQTGTNAAEIMRGQGGRDDLVALGGGDTVIGDTFEAQHFGDAAEQVFRLYQAVLGRAPDKAGHLAWTSRIALEDRDVDAVAQGFMGSPEFQARFGGKDNAEFVTLLYNNVLGRDPDAPGLARWVGDLDAGVARVEVVLGFANSAEFIASTAVAARNFAVNNSASTWGDDVFRLYQATLDRAPDLGGFEGWTDRLGSSTSLLEAADGFVQSTEFKASYDGLSNAGFVTLLYNNVLDRDPDAPGLGNWTDRLDAGMSRAEVVRGFSQSGEFQTATAEAFADWIEAQGTDDVLEGGAGDDLLAGGILSDRFVFTPDAPGADTVMDLEAWDVIDLRGFGYADAAAARAQMTEQAGNAVFADGDVSVTFQTVALAQITDDMILV